VTEQGIGYAAYFLDGNYIFDNYPHLKGQVYLFNIEVFDLAGKFGFVLFGIVVRNRSGSANAIDQSIPVFFYIIPDGSQGT
jgi:hypothetical protein